MYMATQKAVDNRADFDVSAWGKGRLCAVTASG